MVDVRTALLTILDCVDYTGPDPNCRPNEMVGAVLPREVILLAREALTEAKVKELIDLEEEAKARMGAK